MKKQIRPESSILIVTRLTRVASNIEICGSLLFFVNVMKRIPVTEKCILECTVNQYIFLPIRGFNCKDKEISVDLGGFLMH